MGCGCLLGLIAALSPRLALVLVWVFTPLVTRAFDSWVVPLLGFFFLPLTTLFYSLAWSPVGGVRGFGWLLVILGLLWDLGSYATGGWGRRRQRSARYA
jgi:hypothetical protein